MEDQKYNFRNNLSCRPCIWTFFVGYIPRVANGAAHVLAKWSI